ncbi:DUF721 domain-containing protein [Halarcobacter bivalviorum]|uniref:DUF721 domain-containing protein n=1 Tax=Halarcobacter bivalviorum TaxID=663364 RepID=UPI00100ACBA2|nr:DUF721 domain-containing protein [Halarcobacter bivalviorum]RXK08020.1 hypothetical protein CRU97_01355 [Halarcobacter bivalviorum]
MKKINEILSHLKNSPEFRKINTQKTIQDFIELLPATLKKGVKFAYIKADILYFVLTHPVYKMEFEYNKNLINTLLKKYPPIEVNELKFFVTNKREKKEERKEEVPFFVERSHGIFTNYITDEKLRVKVEEIRAIIKNS